MSQVAIPVSEAVLAMARDLGLPPAPGGERQLVAWYLLHRDAWVALKAEELDASAARPDQVETA